MLRNFSHFKVTWRRMTQQERVEVRKSREVMGMTGESEGREGRNCERERILLRGSKMEPEHFPSDLMTWASLVRHWRICWGVLKPQGMYSL